MILNLKKLQHAKFEKNEDLSLFHATNVNLGYLW